MSKESFAETINTMGSNSCLLANECERYGMTWGCDEDCPVLNRGECELYSSVEEYFDEQKQNK